MSRAVDRADPRRGARGQPVGPAGRRERLRPHPAGARAQAGREPHPALLPVPVRPGRGLRPFPDPGRQGPRDHRGPPRPHQSGYAVPTYVIDAPGGGGKIPVMPNYLISYSDHKVVLRNYEGYITTYEEPATYARHDSRPARTASTSARSPASPASTACSRASGCGSSRRLRGGPQPAATPRRTGSRSRRMGALSASAPSRARRARRCPSSRPARRLATATARQRRRTRADYGPGEEPRPREGEPTASAHGELL